MKTIIDYCTSGLGNRLRSLASCAVISQHTGRKFKIYWDVITPNGCLAKFEELFENEIENVTLEEMQNLNGCAVFAQYQDAVREFTKFERESLKKLMELPGTRICGKEDFNYSYNEDNIVIFNNNFLSAVDRQKTNEFLQSLIPVKEIQDKIDSEVSRLELNKSIVGIHARGTDFGVDVSFYTSEIKKILEKKPDTKFFLSTEDPDFEKRICEEFPGKISIGKKDFYIRKVNNNDSWQNHNNFFITKEHAKEAVLDIFLLSKTDIQVYHSNSTFCEIAKIISLKNN
jgi:hypothetical protein